jgi:hypothetical protein
VLDKIIEKPIWIFTEGFLDNFLMFDKLGLTWVCINKFFFIADALSQALVFEVRQVLRKDRR